MSEVFNADVLDALNRALSAENVATREGDEPVYCNVNNETREIEIPGEITIFGVEHDENAVRVFFKCPKIIGDNVDIDITQSMVYIIYINAGGEKDQYIVTDVNETEDGNVTFSWLINRKPAKYQGITQFGIRVIKSKTGGEIENEWNTTVANANILNGVETEDIELSGDNIDVVNQLLDLTKQEIELTKQNSIEEIEQKGQETLATIPSDYTTAAQNALSAKNEVEGIRVGANGKTYPSAGNAVREQFNSLKDDIVNISEYAQSNIFYNDYTDNNVTEAYRGEYGYYRYTDGELIKEQFNATIKIPVSYGDTFIITGTYGYASCLIAEYSRSGNFIKPILYDTEKGVTVTNYEYIVPVNVKYIGISSISNTFNIVQRKYISIKDKLNDTLPRFSNILYGKKWVACGDSYTHGDFTGYIDSNGKSGIESDAYDKTMNMYKTYPWWIAKRNGMTLVNEAINGSTMAYPKSGNPTDTNAFSYERYKNIPVDADYITLWFGINDSSKCNLGMKGDGSVNTFHGAFGTVLYYLLIKHPKAKIGVIITNRSTYEFRQATREVCNTYGIPYLDMMGDIKVPMIFGREESTGIHANIIGVRNAQFVVSSTNSHPNLYAHEYESTFIENWLRSL